MEITVEGLESLEESQRRALVPMLNLIFGYVGTSRWDLDNNNSGDTAFRASLDHFRQAFYGNDPDQLKDFETNALSPNEDMYKRFVIGSDMVVDRFMRSPLGYEKMTLNLKDVQAVASYCNPNWGGQCPWPGEWQIENLILTSFGASITRAFNYAYMTCREQAGEQEGGNNA